MSIEYSNLRTGNKMGMIQPSEFLTKYTDTGEIVDSKIRKFYYSLHDKLIERDLRVTISVVSGDKFGDQNVIIELTIDVNPMFLFLLSITKTDFEALRVDQGLNIDFKDFPEALVNLLNQCKDDISENGGRFKLVLVDYSGTTAGGCIMEMSTIQVKIIEECAFRNICHLTLSVMRGTDVQIRQKLEGELYIAKQILSKTSKMHDEALMKITGLIEEINEKNKIIEKSEHTITELTVLKEEECSKVRNQAEIQEKLLREEFGEKITEERKQFEKQSLHAQSKIENLEKELRLFHEKELEMQNLLHEKEREKELIEVELISKKQEVHQLRNQNEKLDSDYHDKEKTVNILRTRLAVAEQELKDNNTLLLSQQNKLDTAISEKVNFLKNLELIQNKLDKKETTIKNLSDELIKANDIISKQQSKINLLSTKISEYESSVFNLEQLIKVKEEDLCKQNELLNKLQNDLAISVKESNGLKEKSTCLEKKVTELNNSLRCKSKTLKKLRGNVEDVPEYQVNFPRKSLLAYRAYLSMPTLLPSDTYRWTNDLIDFVAQDQRVSDTDIDNMKSFSMSRIIRPYILRYLKRFQSLPLSIFKSLDSPIPVLVSPFGFQSPEGKHLHKTQSHENINHVTEYALYNKEIEHYLPTSQSAVCVGKSNDTLCNKMQNEPFQEPKTINYIKMPDRVPQYQYAYNRSNNNRLDTDFELGDGYSKPRPHYEPVSGFQLKPGRFPRTTTPGTYNDNATLLKGAYHGFGTSKFRTTPAVSAPPLTPEQRKAEDSIFKTKRSQWSSVSHDGKRKILPNISSQSSLLPKSINQYNSLFPQPSLNEVKTIHDSSSNRSHNSKHLIPVLEPMTTTCAIGTRSNAPPSKFSQRLSDETGTSTHKRKNGFSVSKPSLRPCEEEPHMCASDVFERSVDFPEPSAYFAT